MNVIIKYRVEKGFKDKKTKKQIKANDIIDISIERMRELNKYKIGTVEDVIIENDEENILPETQEEEKKNVTKEETENKKYTKEELKEMTVNDLKDLAEKNNIELKSAKKDEIIEEILSK